MAPRASGTIVQIGGSRTLVYERRFAVDAQVLWAWTTESQKLGRWIGTWSGDPASGSVSFLMTAEGATDPEPVAVLVCEPPTRLTVEFAQPGGGVWHLELAIGATTEAGSILTFTHVLQPADDAGDIGPGWDYYLDRLYAATAGVEPEPWEAYYPALASAYREASLD
ncbi:SRPBCC domain-containing protein [Compostimonas suwonensis]|uniref:Activator of Hsp90 ATPase-like protein n=1 Tax=Compostimonas suwonensis TaxID=1048394 RepID=A0A2M9C3X9_9MICO|nr:SRPBCC domain-containing protein [Compostimonas suwonensis]PJJ65199.1 activator of Hsp90 ATPase-like protein [Compostimonas suwonensis]